MSSYDERSNLPMSLLNWFRGFRESIARKQNARVQIRKPLPVGSADFSRAQIWTAPPRGAPEPVLPSNPTAAPDASSFLQEAPTPLRFLADVPTDLREQIQRDGMARAFRRLETPLRALNIVTSRKGVNYPAEELRGFLLMWRQALGDYLGLVADDRSVLVYDRSVDEAYFVRGRCQVGAHLTIVEPCWKLDGVVVVRGEAQVIQGWVR
jgi:hypothetical protein